LSTNNAITANMGDGSDTVLLGNAGNSLGDIKADLTLNGEGDTDSLQLLDSGSSASKDYTLRAGEVRQNGRTFPYGGLGTFRLGATAGPNSIFVLPTAAGTTTTVNAGPGADAISVGNLADKLDDIQGAVTVNGQGDTDSLTINDGRSATGQTFTINAHSVA